MFIFSYKTYIALFLLGLVSSFLITPSVRRLALRLGALDEPDKRKVHEKATPLLGGAAVFLPFLALLGSLMFLRNDVTEALFSEPMHILGLVLCGALAFGLGIYDDFRGANAGTKLLAEAGIAVIAYAIGFRIRLVALPFVGELDLGILGFLVTILWVVGITNALNLIDGLDGLAAGVALFVCAGEFFVSLLLNNAFMAVVSIILVGCLAGFLVYNFPPASIFLGDTGSLFLGTVLALSTLLSAQKGPTVIMITFPIIALGLPILDTLLAIFRRTLAGVPIFKSDKNHIHHALLALGLSHKRAVLVLYLFCFVLLVTAVVVVSGRRPSVLVVLAGTALLSGLGVRALGYTTAKNIKTALGRRRRRRYQRRLTKRAVTDIARASSFPELWQVMVRAAKELDYTQIEIAYGAAGADMKLTEQLKNPQTPSQPTDDTPATPTNPCRTSSKEEQFTSGTGSQSSGKIREERYPLPEGLGTVTLIKGGDADPGPEADESLLARRVVSAFSRRLVHRLPYNAPQPEGR